MRGLRERWPNTTMTVVFLLIWAVVITVMILWKPSTFIFIGLFVIVMVMLGVRADKRERS